MDNQEQAYILIVVTAMAVATSFERVVCKTAADECLNQFIKDEVLRQNTVFAYEYFKFKMHEIHHLETLEQHLDFIQGYEIGRDMAHHVMKMVVAIAKKSTFYPQNLNVVKSIGDVLNVDHMPYFSTPYLVK